MLVRLKIALESVSVHLIMKTNDYVEVRDEGWYVRDSRVSLDSLIYAFYDGLSPEAIVRECFPTLRLEQVYGAIAAYLANRAVLDAYLRTSKSKAEAWREAQRNSDLEFSKKMAQARRELMSATS